MHCFMYQYLFTEDAVEITLLNCASTLRTLEFAPPSNFSRKSKGFCFGEVRRMKYTKLNPGPKAGII